MMCDPLRPATVVPGRGKHRRWDGAVWFAMNVIPDTPGAVVRVGDEVEVLESEPAPDGPPR